MENNLFKTMTIGKKIEKIRNLKEIKQEVLAQALGVTRQAISKLEQSEYIDDEKLKLIADALGTTVDAIKNVTEEAIYNFVQNNYEGSNKDSNNLFVTNNNCNFNPLDKVIELVEENKKLYERLLKSEQDKIEMLQKLLDKK